MKCFYHNDRETSQECCECHKPLCAECCYVNENSGLIMCKDCAAIYNKKLKNKLIRQAIYLGVLVVCFVLSMVFFGIKKPILGVVFLWVGGVIPAYTVVSEHILFFKTLPNTFLWNALRTLIGLVLSPLMIVWYVICFIRFAKDYKSIQATIKTNKQIEAGAKATTTNLDKTLIGDALTKKRKIFLIILLVSLAICVFGLSIIAIKSFAGAQLPNLFVSIAGAAGGAGSISSIVFLILFLVTNSKIKKNK